MLDRSDWTRRSVKEGLMGKRYVLLFLILLVLLSGFAVWMSAQDREQNSNVIRVTVAMVQLNVAVTDNKGDYVTGLHPSDFVISEDGIPQTVATFEEGNEGPQNLVDIPQGKGTPKPGGPNGSSFTEGPQGGSPRSGVQQGSLEGLGSAVSGANVFILFDTSNYMYKGRGFVYAQDAIADFIRSLDTPY